MAVKYSGLLRFTDEIKAEIDLAADGAVEKAVIIDGDGVETPIGGGGTSDFTTAEVTIKNNTGSDIYMALPVMSERRNYISGGIAMAANSTKPPFLIVLYKGKALGSIVTGNPQSAACTGDITVRDGGITIEGNGTITFGTAS